MSLSDAQRRFTALLPILLQYGNARPGYAVRLDMAARSMEEQQRLMEAGATKTLDSGHTRRLAADLIVDRWDGRTFVTSWEPVDYKPLGAFWKSLDPRCMWGGDWDTLRDYGHFEYAWASGGVSSVALWYSDSSLAS